MAASPAYRLAQASDTRAFGFLVSLALHAGVLAAYGLWSHSPRLIPERREEPRTVTIMTLPSLETEQPSARRAQRWAIAYPAAAARLRAVGRGAVPDDRKPDRKSTRLNSSH